MKNANSIHLPALSLALALVDAIIAVILTIIGFYLTGNKPEFLIFMVSYLSIFVICLIITALNLLAFGLTMKYWIKDEKETLWKRKNK